MTPMVSMFIKIAKLRFDKKRGGKGSDVELRFGESPPTSGNCFGALKVC